MESWLQLSLLVRMALLFLCGVAGGHVVNWAVARFRIRQFTFHPWTKGASGNPPRGWLDRVPLLCWWRLRREASIHGRGFWIRPLVVELLCGAIWIGLYWWEVDQRGLLSAEWHTFISERVEISKIPREVDPDPTLDIPGFLENLNDLDTALIPTFLLHAILSLFLFAATLIDWDETIIPDEITVPGTLLALLFIFVFPVLGLPRDHNYPWWELVPIDLFSPLDWNVALDGKPHLWGLLLGLGCFGTWCFGLLPRVWYGRFAWSRAWRYFWGTIGKDGSWVWVVPIWIFGSALIVAAWWLGLGPWRALLSSLFGMFIGGMALWSVRVVARFVLGVEALGFGDVTLVAMIGAVTGWQAVLPIFFIAPWFALILGIVKWVSHGEHESPYGPFLCLGTMVTIVAWAPIWNYLQPIYATGWMVPAVMGACLVLLVVLLPAVRWILRGSR